MRKIRLKEYKNTLLYMYMFDEVLKVNCKRNVMIKEDSLKECKVNPSSFRRCKMSEQEVGKSIVNKLAYFFQ